MVTVAGRRRRFYRRIVRNVKLVRAVRTACACLGFSFLVSSVACNQRREPKDVGTQWRAIWMYVASGRDDVRDEEKAAELLSLVKALSQRHTGYWFMEAVRAVVYAANEDSARAVKILDTMLKSKHPLGPDVKERIARLKQKIESGEPVRWNCERKDRPILSWPPLHLGLGVDLSQGFTVSAY